MIDLIEKVQKNHSNMQKKNVVKPNKKKWQGNIKFVGK